MLSAHYNFYTSLFFKMLHILAELASELRISIIKKTNGGAK